MLNILCNLLNTIQKWKAEWLCEYRMIVNVSAVWLFIPWLHGLLGAAAPSHCHTLQSMVSYITSLGKRWKFKDEVQFLLNPYDVCSFATSENHSRPIIHLEPSVLYSILLSYLPGGSLSCVLVTPLNSLSHYFLHEPLISVT